jgi:hypothetical protein
LITKKDIHIYLYYWLRKKSDIRIYQLPSNALYKWIGNDTGLLGENEISFPSLNYRTTILQEFACLGWVKIEIPTMKTVE